MSWNFILILIWSVAFLQADPLTKQENTNRLATCGKIVQSKVYKGRDAAQKEAPWSVYIMAGREICTGTVVSSRHILTATHCFSGQNQDGWKTVQSGGTANCKDKNYVISDPSYLQSVKIMSNGVAIAQNPEKITLLEGCDNPTLTAEQKASHMLWYPDFAIIDLYDELPGFSATLQPACVDKDTSTVRAGSRMSIFGFGTNPATKDVNIYNSPGPHGEGKLRHEKLTVLDKTTFVPIHPSLILAREANGTSVACPGDSGGGAVLKVGVERRTTIVGVLSQTTCGLNQPQREGAQTREMYASTGYFAKDICKLTGVCEPTEYDTYLAGYSRVPKPPRATLPPVTSRPDLNPNPSNDSRNPPTGGGGGGKGNSDAQGQGEQTEEEEEEPSSVPSSFRISELALVLSLIFFFWI